MIQRGDKITVLHTYKTPVRGVVTIVWRPSVRQTVEFDWMPAQTMSPNFVIHLLSTFSEGWVWVHGHGEEQEHALLAARALR